MRFLEIRLQDFRNYPLTALDVSAPAHFIVGANGRGKTNLLEALGLITAFRSFRTQDLRACIRWKSAGTARVLYRVEHEERGETEVELSFARGQKSIRIDGENISRLGDFIGVFPTVAFTSDDIQLLRGAPGDRRRFIDLVLSATSPEYYEALRIFHRSLRERNRLLKANAGSAELRAFTEPLIRSASRVIGLRRAGLKALAGTFVDAYNTIAPEAKEKPVLLYKPDADVDSEDALRARFDETLERDRVLQSTSAGPHRDDISLRLLDHRAREYASEGQQRGLVLALRLAEAKWYFDHNGVRPVILADDILNELDATRKAGFWRALDPDSQLFATGTREPETDARAWEIHRVGEE